MDNISYTDSHKREGKGPSYDESYAKDPWSSFLWSREQKMLAKIIDIYYEGKKIELLDFACGTGRITSFLENRVTTSTGMDVSDTMLNEARSKLERTEIIQSDITQNDVLGDRKFNLITAFRFFVNAEPALRNNVIKALVRHLSEDGYFVFNNHQCLNSPWTKLYYWHHLRKCPDLIYNVMTIAQMKELVEQVGLEIVQVYPVGYFHPPKIKVPNFINNAIDSVASKISVLKLFSESPIAVCRRRNKTG